MYYAATPLFLPYRLSPYRLSPYRLIASCLIALSPHHLIASRLIASLTLSMSHLGVEVAPQIPTRSALWHSCNISGVRSEALLTKIVQEFTSRQL